jgi:hypothetical protein
MSQSTCTFNGFIIPNVGEFTCIDEETGRPVNRFVNKPDYERLKAIESLEGYIEQSYEDAMIAHGTLKDDKCTDMAEDLKALRAIDAGRGDTLQKSRYIPACERTDEEEIKPVASLTQNMTPITKSLTVLTRPFEMVISPIIEAQSQMIPLLLGCGFFLNEQSEGLAGAFEENETVVVLDLMQDWGNPLLASRDAKP